MLNQDFSVTANDYPKIKFPEFYPEFIDEVLAQLNAQLQNSLADPIPEAATLKEARQCLIDDIRKHPDVYLTAGLISKITRTYNA